MKTQSIPQTNLAASSVVLGLMRIADMDDGQIRPLFDGALAAGVTVFDHADIYGVQRHRCEERFGQVLQLTPAEHSQIAIQSKVGIRSDFFDFSSSHILNTVDETLAALGTEYLDVLLLHRPDTLVEPEDVAEAFDKLYASGKVRHFGVSNHTPGQIELLKTAVQQPLAINQIHLSLTHAHLFSQGLAANMGWLGQSVTRDLGLLDYSRLNGITLQAWSPFINRPSNRIFIGDRENYAELNDVLDELASKYGVTPTGIAVAWITRHPANIQVVIGTTKTKRIFECGAGSDVALTREDWYGLFRAAGHTLP